MLSGPPRAMGRGFSAPLEAESLKDREIFDLLGFD
jgi:hypothetical protein